MSSVEPIAAMLKEALPTDAPHHSRTSTRFAICLRAKLRAQWRFSICMAQTRVELVDDQAHSWARVALAHLRYAAELGALD